MRIIFTTYENLILDSKEIEDKTSVVFNLSSLREGYKRVDLFPPFLKEYSDKEFDMNYANYILNTEKIFFEFMKKIIMPLYYDNKSVYILISKGNVFDELTESLQKFIQQRYGLISNNINDAEDYEYLEDADFSILGLYNLDIDKEKYSNFRAIEIMNEKNKEIGM